MLNYESVGGVNFKKGCYPGQEVVARSQFRGTLKRRAHVFHSPVALAAGDEVFHSEDAEQPCGSVVAAAPTPSGGWDAVVSVQLSALGSGSVHLGQSDGPVLTALPLPYPLLADI
jgi:folate-binding Fe-S cluster repair protein YgfZ